ncbi:hypothetical protein DMN91_008281 [Ooceraea biroi]|uniref:Uncharacterized protein n=1 Tax=Ooceraea biroi TaxID=2015173 RepID=A0A3L8DH12_OOCBI|nr:hypothetical protein DMN91_008281 [Ooceraea biroi]
MKTDKASTKNLLETNIDQNNAMETKRKSDETKIFTIKSIPEKEESFTMKGINSSGEERKISRKENNEILKRTTESKSYSKEINDSKKGNKSVRECKEGTFAKINSVDQLDKTRSIRGELPSGGSKCNAKDREKTKIGDVTVTDGRRQRRPLRDIIGKREQRRKELEKVEGNLRQRLDMLECSMPAVMVWNIWRMAQGAPVCRIKHILEKQFEDTRELSCRSTPSRHYDCRVREIEAERKLALKKVEEARNLWSEKLTTLEERKRKLEEVRRIQEEQKCAMERLNEETRILRETTEKPEMDESCRYGECGDTQCKQRWLDKVPSVTSIKSGDIQCLEKLQRLAEEEITMKRDIAELERREEAYMRTLQQADELWSKMESDTMNATRALQEQLEMKTAANQQLAERVCELEDALEKCRTRMAACRAELEKFLSIEKVEAMIGRDDDVAKVTDKEVIARVKVVHRPIGKVDDVATVENMEVQVKVEVADEETLTKVEVADEEALARIALIDADVEAAVIGDDKYVSAIPEVTDIGIDRPVDLVRVEDAEGIVQPEDFAYEEQRFKEVREYLAELDSLEDLYKDDGEPCAPDFVCNDVVSSPTGMTDEELTSLGIEPPAPTKELDRKLVVSEQEREKPFQKELKEKTDDIVKDIEKKEKKVDETPSIKVLEREKAETLVAEVMDVKPARETLTRGIEEDITVDRPITIPDDVKMPEIKKKEIDQDIVIQRDTILSWVDTIDIIREKVAKHPDCHAVKKDADILVKEVSAYVGIKPKKIQEEDVTIITAEEISVKEDSPVEFAESKLLPKLTKEEIFTDMEPSTVVSIEDSFQPPTTPIEEDLKGNTVLQLNELVPNKVEIERKELKETIQVEETMQNAKEAEISQINEVKEDATIEDLTDKKLVAETVENNKIVNSTDKEKRLAPQKVENKEEKEVISNHVKNNEKIEDIPKGAVIEKEVLIEKIEVKEVLPVSKEINEHDHKLEIPVLEKLEEISQLNKIKMVDVDETAPHVEIIETKEITEAAPAAAVPPIAEVKEVEPDIIEEAILTIAMKKVKELREPEEVSPLVDSTEKEKLELPIADVEEVPIANAVEDVIKVEKLPLILDTEKEKLKVEEPLIQDIETVDKVKMKEPIQVTDIIHEKIEVAELPVITNEIKEKAIEVEEPSPIADVIKEELETVQLVIQPPLVKQEELPVTEELVEIELIKVEEPSLIPDTVKEEIETVQPVIQPPTIVKKEVELPIVEKLVEVELPKTELIEIQQVYEEREKEEILPLKKEGIPETVEVAEIALPTVSAVDDKKEKVPIEKKPEIVVDEVRVEEKVPVAETKPSEPKMLAIPIDPRLMAQPYFVIAKIKEKELLHIIPAMRHACIECCSVSNSSRCLIASR